MAMVRAGELDVVQVTQMDRLYRQPIELEAIIPQIEAASVLIATVREGDMNLKIDTDQLRARVQVAFARAEVQRKANRQIVANEEAAKRGKRNVTGARPFGYPENRIDPLEPEAQAVRDAIDSVLRGGSVNGIARRWSSLGLHPPLAPFGPLTEHPWRHRSVRHILMNPHIAGLRSYKGVIVAAGDWVPLVTVEKWEAAQLVLSDPGRVKPRGALSLLGGIAECRCGSEVKHATRPQRGRTPGYGTYRCAAYEKEGHVGKGPHVCIKADWIDDYVEDVLLTTMERPDAAQMFAPPDAVDVPRLKEELATYDVALERLSWQQSTGLITDAVFMTNAAKINAERETIAVQITEAGQAQRGSGAAGRRRRAGRVGGDEHLRAARGHPGSSACTSRSGRPGPGAAGPTTTEWSVSPGAARRRRAAGATAVTEPVRLYVAAKRYLCATEPGYFGRLSPESVRTLARQGGPMTPEQAAAFEALPYARDAVAVRRWDHQAKDPAVSPPEFSHFAALLRALLKGDLLRS